MNQIEQVEIENGPVADEGKNKSSMRSWVVFVLVLACSFVLFRYVIGFTVIAGDSMNPTLEDSDVLITSGIFYEVERNDVIIYRDKNGFDVIKRVIGMPNETIEISNGIVYVDGSPVDENFITGTPKDMPEMIINEDSFFVMGDNRQPGESLDSRDPGVGAIPKELIKGEATLSIFPFGVLK